MSPPMNDDGLCVCGRPRDASVHGDVTDGHPFQPWQPVTPADVTDDKLVSGQLRALQREVRSGFELITQKVLTAVERLTEKVDDIKAEMADTKAEVAALKREQARTHERLAALEKKRRKPVGKK